MSIFILFTECFTTALICLWMSCIVSIFVYVFEQGVVRAGTGLGWAVPILPHCTTFLTFPSYNLPWKTQHIRWSWIKPAGPTGATGNTSIQPPWHWSNPNSWHRARMRIHASAELWRCVELPGSEQDTGQGKTGWKNRGERDGGWYDRSRGGGGGDWESTEMDEVSVWSGECGWDVNMRWDLWI